MIQAVRGTKDILPSEISTWHSLEELLRRIAGQFGFQEIRTPIFEHTELFARGIGETTDIVGKEMYTFFDQSQTSLTLRPEATASIARAVLEHTLLEKNPLLRLWYMGPMFRQERPQKGRFRQFHQFDAELIGSSYPEADVEIIALAYTLLRSLGLSSFELHLNSLGSISSRMRYRAALQQYFRPHIAAMSDDSKQRIETNPLRILDSKHPDDTPFLRDAPQLIDYLDDESRNYFEHVQKLLTALEIPYIVDYHLVRGLDYYCHTAFEFITSRLGAQNALGGGGRYDGLFEQLGGKHTPAIGFAFGIERLLLLLSEENKAVSKAQRTDVYIITLDDESRAIGMRLAQHLRSTSNFIVATDTLRRSLKAQMRDADRTQSRFVAIIGENERLNNTIILKEMASGAQQLLPLDNIPTLLRALDTTAVEQS
ncbi:MAG: histidine--tRNA ligase [Bacteroidota bacterium]|nr:histidine--tRNA ligase [Candidatus Kapabacteria bacterium]MDW8219901.1 histidine--tRNA ligase [Bacteroidota bacterium]